MHGQQTTGTMKYVPNVAIAREYVTAERGASAIGTMESKRATAHATIGVVGSHRGQFGFALPGLLGGVGDEPAEDRFDAEHLEQLVSSG